MTPANPSETILGAAPAPLGLRIRGTDRDGQVVWLRSSKVTIGSGRTSTLRLRAPGVAPLHCVILRGAERTVARCWSLDTRCNGHAFNEALLAVGDRLSVGPLEFEVVEEKAEGRKQKAEATEIAPVVDQRLVEAQPMALVAEANAAREVRDAEALRKVRRLAARFKLSRRQARRRILKLTDELRFARSQSADLESQLQQQRSEAARYESRQIEWDLQRKAIDAERQQWLQTQAHIEQLLAELDKRSDTGAQTMPVVFSSRTETSSALEQETAALRGQLDAEKRSWESQRAAWETELSQRQTAMAQESDRLQRMQDHVERQQGMLEQQIENLSQRQKLIESRGDELAASQHMTDDQRGLLRVEIEKLDKERIQFAAEQEALGRDRAELTQRRTELEESTAKLQTAQQELDAQLEQLAADRREFEAQRSELQEVAEERKRLAEELETLNSAKSELQLQQQQLAETEQQIAQAREELLQTRLEWEAENAHKASLRSSEPRPFNLPTQFLAASEAARQQARDAASAVENEEPAEEVEIDLSGDLSTPDSPAESGEPSAPKEADDLFARLRALNIFKGDGNQAQDEPSTKNVHDESDSTDTEAISEIASRTSQATFPNLAAPDATPEPSVEEEESIDDYMARLLQRVGKGNSSAPVAASTATSAKKTPEKAPAALVADKAQSTSAAAEVEAPMKNLSELEPRTAAPEKTRDLAAMREIANFAARTAIAKYAWRSRIVTLLKRFTMGIVALVCGLILILLAPAMSSHYFLCGLAAITAALLWFLPAIYRAKKCNNQAQNAQQQAVDDYENSPAEGDQTRSR
jgi:hypothetical protein